MSGGVEVSKKLVETVDVALEMEVRAETGVEPKQAAKDTACLSVKVSQACKCTKQQRWAAQKALKIIEIIENQ